MGDCSRVLWVPGPWGKYSGKIRFIEKCRVQNAMLLNVVLTPGKPYPKSNFRNGTQCELWVLLPLCPSRGRYQGKIRFIEAQGGNGSLRRVSGAPSSGTPRESQAKFRVGIVWGL